MLRFPVLSSTSRKRVAQCSADGDNGKSVVAPACQGLSTLALLGYAGNHAPELEMEHHRSLQVGLASRMRRTGDNDCRQRDEEDEDGTSDRSHGVSARNVWPNERSRSRHSSLAAHSDARRDQASWTSRAGPHPAPSASAPRRTHPDDWRPRARPLGARRVSSRVTRSQTRLARCCSLVRGALGPGLLRLGGRRKRRTAAVPFPPR